MPQWDDFLSELDKEAQEILLAPLHEVKESIYRHHGYDYNPFDVLLPLNNPDFYVPDESVFKWFVKQIVLQLRMLTSRESEMNETILISENYLLAGAIGQGKSTFLYMLGMALNNLETFKKLGNISILVLPFMFWVNKSSRREEELKELLSRKTDGNVIVISSLEELENVISTKESDTDVWILLIDDAHLLLDPTSQIPPLNALMSLFFDPVLIIGTVPLGLYLYLLDFYDIMMKDAISTRVQQFFSYFNGTTLLLPALPDERMHVLLKKRLMPENLVNAPISDSLIRQVVKHVFGNPRLALESLYQAFVITRRLGQKVINEDVLMNIFDQLGLTRLKWLKDVLFGKKSIGSDELKPLMGKRLKLLEILMFNSYWSEISASREGSEQWARHIARLLSVSPSTLSYHLKTLMEFSGEYFPIVKEKTDPKDHRAKILTVNDHVLPILETLILYLKEREEKKGEFFRTNEDETAMKILPSVNPDWL